MATLWIGTLALWMIWPILGNGSYPPASLKHADTPLQQSRTFEPDESKELCVDQSSCKPASLKHAGSVLLQTRRLQRRKVTLIDDTSSRRRSPKRRRSKRSRSSSRRRSKRSRSSSRRRSKRSRSSSRSRSKRSRSSSSSSRSKRSRSSSSSKRSRSKKSSSDPRRRSSPKSTPSLSRGSLRTNVPEGFNPNIRKGPDPKIRKGANLTWETGTVQSGVAVLIEESYSINGNSKVIGRGGKPYTANSLHNLKVVKVPWAREGAHVVRVYADGRNFGTRKDYAFRSEFGACASAYTFAPGDYHYFTSSFWPDESWDQVKIYSTVITQWKMSPGLPHAALRLSNTGDYKLTFRGYDLWKSETDEGKFIGYASRRAWNDIKVFAKWSLGKDGFIKVWLNGTQVFEHKGRTLLKRTPRGYVKWGMYTEIRDKRIIYFDNVRFSNYLDVPLKTWLKDQANLPSISLTRPANQTQTASGREVSLTALAVDPAGMKIGTPGGITKVEFFAGKCRIGDATASPYVAKFSPPDGSYALTAVITDSDGNIATSARVDIHVGNRPPEVAIASPVMQANFNAGETYPIRAAATDPDGQVSHVDFYVGDVKIGVAKPQRNGVFSVNWQAAGAGAYSLHAVATDAAGKSRQSKPIHITVGAKIETSAVKPLDDASVREERPSDPANWGEVEVYGKPGGQIVGLFKFDISAYRQAQEIRKAVLKLYISKMKPQKASEFSVFSALGHDWTEDSVTWRNKPTKGDRLSSTMVSKSGQYYYFDVTSFVSDMVTANKGLITLWIEASTLEYNNIQIDSRREEKKNKPQLEITTSSIALVGDDAAPGGTAPNCQAIMRR